MMGTIIFNVRTITNDYRVCMILNYILYGGSTNLNFVTWFVKFRIINL